MTRSSMASVNARCMGNVMKIHESCTIVDGRMRRRSSQTKAQGNPQRVENECDTGKNAQATYSIAVAQQTSTGATTGAGSKRKQSPTDSHILLTQENEKENIEPTNTEPSTEPNTEPSTESSTGADIALTVPPTPAKRTKSSNDSVSVQTEQQNDATAIDWNKFTLVERCRLDDMYAYNKDANSMLTDVLRDTVHVLRNVKTLHTAFLQSGMAAALAFVENGDIIVDKISESKDVLKRAYESSRAAQDNIVEACESVKTNLLTWGGPPPSDPPHGDGLLDDLEGFASFYG